MADASRLEELKRRVQRDPASPAFAQLAEEHRRAGQPEEAVRVCRAGLRHHPAYHSARVTLARALLALGDLAAAERELDAVLRASPENLAACRVLGEIHEREGRPAPALAYFRRALTLAPDDQQLAAHVTALELAVSATGGRAVSPSDGAAPESTPEPGENAEGVRQLLLRLERWLQVLKASHPS